MYYQNTILFNSENSRLAGSIGWYKRQWLFGLFFLSSVSLWAQKPTSDNRAQRDTEVLQTVLTEYFKEANPDKTKYRVSTRRSNVNYFSGFGLLIAAPAYVPGSGRVLVGKNEFCYSYSTGSDCDEDNSAKASADKGKPAAEVKIPDNEQIVSVMKGFLTNYSNLMGFIQPGEKIIFYYDKKNEPGDGIRTTTQGQATGKAKPERIVLEIRQEDTRLPGQELAAKAKPTITANEQTGKPEFEIMGKIFHSTFDNSQNSPFISTYNNVVFIDGASTTSSKTSYELFNGLGVIYNFSVNYARSFGRSHSFVVTPRATVSVNSDVVEVESHNEKELVKRKKKEKTKDQKETPAPKPAKAVASPNDDKNKEKENRDQQAALEYTRFLKAVKNYMIEYGRTLRSLQPNERLIVTITVNSWSSSQLPKKIELSVPRSVMDEYDKRTLSLEEATSKVTLQEYTKSDTDRIRTARTLIFSDN